MRPDYSCPCTVLEKEPDGKKVEHFPSVYISNEEMPKLKIGQEVTIKGVVTSYGVSERSHKDGEGSKNSKECNATVECKVLIASGKDYEPEAKEKDIDAIDKGLDEAEEMEEEMEEEE